MTKFQALKNHEECLFHTWEWYTKGYPTYHKFDVDRELAKFIERLNDYCRSL